MFHPHVETTPPQKNRDGERREMEITAILNANADDLRTVYSTSWDWGGGKGGGGHIYIFFRPKRWIDR